MTRGALLVAALLLATASARAQTEDDSNSWTPKAEMLEELDSQAVQLRLKGASAPLETYERYYRGTKRGGRLFIEGYFGPFRTEGKVAAPEDLPERVHIVARAEPSIADAGCRVVFLLYDVSAEAFASIQCEGEQAAQSGGAQRSQK
jgi:hypothetical protein